MGTNEILTTYFSASREEITAGKTWYADAMALATTLAHTADDTRPMVTVDMVAGVIAALSPLTPWERNKELAIRAVVEHQATGTLGNSTRNANRILAGEPTREVLKSDKVWNFYLCITGDPDAVCIDRHAWEVFEGKRYADKERPKVTPRRYRKAAMAYREAAHALTLQPSELQAITWLVWRRAHLTGTRYERVL
jgi:hypothetical protein